MSNYRKTTKRSYTAKKCEKHKTTKHHQYIIPFEHNGEQLAYRFVFAAGTPIGQVRRTMRDVAKRLGDKPYDLYKPGALNFPELLTKNEMRRYWLETVEEWGEGLCGS